jgi:hypothetical protein
MVDMLNRTQAFSIDWRLRLEGKVFEKRKNGPIVEVTTIAGKVDGASRMRSQFDRGWAETDVGGCVRSFKTPHPWP